MSQRIGLDAYFKRIGFDGVARPDLATLRAIHWLHPATIAFENLNPLMRRGVPLDIDSLQHKMVYGRRGGWCFEQNTLLQHALAEIGFEVEGLIARVLWNQPEDAITARSHKVLRVRIDGMDYVADAGFGGNVMTGPLQLAADVAQTTPHQPYRLAACDDGYKAQSLIAGEWKTMYRFDLAPQRDIDYEVASHFVESHPSSIFLTNLLVGLAPPGARYGLLNNLLNAYDLNGPRESRVLKSGAEIRNVLETVFKIDVPADADDALARLVPA
jgi:N-hydroxyarylamine O-acetyltransferase